MHNNDAKKMLRKFMLSIILIIILAVVKHLVLQHYISSINVILKKYGLDATNQLQLLDNIETLLYILILALIIIISISIFLPTLKGLSRALNEVNEKNENIMKLFKIAHGALLLVELESCNIMLMNKEAEKLINAEYKEGLNINEYIKIKSLDFCDVIDVLNENDQNEKLEVELILNGNEKMHAIVTAVKTSYNNKNAVLMGLFDISKQKQSEESFKNIAIKDKLTGAYNRYYFEKRVNDNIEEAEKFNESISMLMLDLDHFKNINDTYGHPVGDEVLKLIAARLNSIIRKSDYLFRVGGEEFVVLMPMTDMFAADKVAEKIRAELEKIEHPVAGKITASIGVAERLKLEMLDDWYKRVDRALYCAKEGGRNCVVNYGENINYATAHIEWNKDWDSGNKILDKQHRELIDLGNTLMFMNLSNYEFYKIINQLEKLINHIENHFRYEEELIKEANFSDFEEHKQIHAKLVNKANELKSNCLNGTINKAAFFSFLLDDVVIDHMVREDKKFYYLIKD